MRYYVRQIHWGCNDQAVRHIREKVFVFELNIPKSIEFDKLDNHAAHLLMLAENYQPIATARLCQDGLVGRVAILPHYRSREAYQQLLQHVIKLADESGLQQISIHCRLNEIDSYTQKGFVATGSVFMEAGIARQRLECTLESFDSSVFTLVH